MNKCQVFCFATIVVVLACHHVQANPLLKGQDAVEYENCKNICNLCNCIGFYCGDECICECFNKNDESECELLTLLLFLTAILFQILSFFPFLYLIFIFRCELCSRSTK